MKDLFKRMIKNPLRLALKMFGLLWFFLFLHIFLKVTFNYWQPYVIPTPQLEMLGNFIDSHKWLQATLNGIFYVINGLIVVLCGTQQWWFKSKKEFLIILVIITLLYVINETLYLDDYTIIVGWFILPLSINYKRVIWIIGTFILTLIFLPLSLWLEGFANANNMNYIIGTFFQIDYYLMLGLNYILFNLIRIYLDNKKLKKEMKNNGR